MKEAFKRFVVFGAILKTLLISGDTRIEPVYQATDNVKIEESVLDNLKFLYSNVQRELPFYLEGEVNDSSIVINDIGVPRIIYSDSVKSVYRKDNKPSNYLGMVHNHMSGACFPSQVDVSRFLYDYEAKLEMIVCGASVEEDSLEYYITNRDIF